MPIRYIEPSGSTSNPGAQGGGPDPADYVRFAIGSVRRRKGVAFGLFLLCISTATAYFLIATRQYRAEARILAQRQQSLPSLVRSNASEDRPTRAAWEIIHRRENLEDLVRSAGILETQEKGGRFDWLARRVEQVADGAPDDDALERLVYLLDKRLRVEVSDVAIAIELDWPDPQQAYRIVEAAVQNFLEARHVQEVTTLDEAIAILRGRAAVLRDELERATEEARRSAGHDPSRASRPPGAASSTPLKRPGSEDLVRLKSMLDAKERAIADVEDFRRRRLADLQAQYESRRAVYAETHPEMMSRRLDIEALNGDSPQITALRAEEKQLREEYRDRLGREPSNSEIAERPVALGTGTSVDQNERVREARTRYQEVMESVSRAQVELDTARSAFRHRYKVIWPAQVPKKPVSPQPIKVFGLGFLVSILLALLVPALLDWRSGKLLERWQIERGLDLPVLGQARIER